MREINWLDLAIAIFASSTGVYSIGNAVGIWRVRNGGIFVRALCAKLVAFGIWGMFVLVNTLIQWYSHNLVSVFAQNMVDVARLILVIPQAVILLVVLPKARIVGK